jgi:hypothetical protein
MSESELALVGDKMVRVWLKAVEQFRLQSRKTERKETDIKPSDGKSENKAGLEIDWQQTKNNADTSRRPYSLASAADLATDIRTGTDQE